MKFKPQDLFGLMVRGFGLYLLRLGFLYIYDFVYYSRVQGSPYSDQGGLYLLGAFFYLAMGIYCLGGASHVVRWSSRDAADESDDLKEETGGADQSSPAA